MNRTTLLALILLLAAWMLCALFICQRCLSGTVLATGDRTTTISNHNTPKVAVDKTLSGPWIIKDGAYFDYQAKHYFRFLPSSFLTLTPESKSTNETLTDVAAYLMTHPDRSLNIIGYYAATENNPSVFSDLGLARANDIKKLLLAQGVDPHVLTTEGQLLPQNWIVNDTLRRGIAFKFQELNNYNERLTTIKSRLMGKPLMLYFATDQPTLNLDASQRQDLSEMIYYLDNEPKANIKVEGHTDNKGERTYNVTLSRERANFVQDYLSKNGGIAKDRMIALGFGPDRPIEKNHTELGRAKNRRVEITLQE